MPGSRIKTAEPCAGMIGLAHHSIQAPPSGLPGTCLACSNWEHRADTNADTEVLA